MSNFNVVRLNTIFTIKRLCCVFVYAYIVKSRNILNIKSLISFSKDNMMISLNQLIVLAESNLYP